MKKLEILLNKLDFKKAVKIYISASIILLLLCALSIAYVSKDKIYMALDYGKVSENFEKNGLTETVKAQLNKLASDSKDIVNIIAADKNNNITYKLNSDIVGNNNKFTLMPYETNKGYLQDNINKDIIYKVVKNENVILSKDYIKSHDKIISDIDDDFYYQQDFDSQKVNLMNYLVSRHTQDRVYIIRTASQIPYAESLLKITGLIAGLLFMIYWIGLALWVYRDADRKNNNPALWGLMVLITNIIGLIIYTMYKQNNRICDNCGSIQDKDNVFCTNCGTQINKVCSNCHSIIGKKDHYCSKCGEKIL